MLSRPLTVMTRNLYVGADITEPLRAATGASGPAALDALGHASRDVLRAAQNTDFAVRGRLLAQEMAAAAPDLIGLQEVALWRRSDLDLSRIAVPSAETVVWDFLEILLAELASCGAAYEIGHIFVGADVEAPAFTGSVLDGTARGENIRLTMRDVVLVRAGAGIQVLARHAGAFESRLVAEVAGASFAFAHGYVRVEVARGADRMRFITTHLDSESPAVALAQAGELVAAAGEGDVPAVVVGDFNSDPADPITSAPYDSMRAAGFVDTAAEVGADGPTFGFGASLTDLDSSGFSQRIDFAFARAGLRVVSAARTGVCAPDRDPTTGLWPSDHAGVVVTLT